MKITEKVYDLQSLNFLRDAKLKIGVLGGSFNPAHSGHLCISLRALQMFGLDYVIWLVANQNPLKEKYKAKIFSRAESALKIISHPRIIVSTAEYDLGTRYTYDTMRKMIVNFASSEFYWLMGFDNIMNFHHWHHYEQFTKLCKIIIFDRPGSFRFMNHCQFLSKFKPTVAKFQTNNIIIDKGFLNPISSTLIQNKYSNYLK